MSASLMGEGGTRSEGGKGSQGKGRRKEEGGRLGGGGGGRKSQTGFAVNMRDATEITF